MTFYGICLLYFYYFSILLADCLLLLLLVENNILSINICEFFFECVWSVGNVTDCIALQCESSFSRAWHSQQKKTQAADENFIISQYQTIEHL
jgi:hypothetical protein